MQKGEKNPLNANTVIRDSTKTVNAENMSEKNPLNVNTVTRDSTETTNAENMKGFTQDFDHSNVNTVKKDLH